MPFFHGIRLRLLVVALALLALPWLAGQLIAAMEKFLRQSQAEQLSATARLVAAALSDRPELFHRGSESADAEGEERRRIIALFAAADTTAVASLGNAYAPSEDIEKRLAVMGRPGWRIWVIDSRSRVRGLSGRLPRPSADTRSIGGWLRPVASLIVPVPHFEAGDESKPVRAQIDRALIGISSIHRRGTRDRDAAIVSAAQPIFNADDIVGAVVVEETTAAIQLLRQPELERLLAVTLLVAGAALVVLLAFATRLAGRIRKLHAQAEAAIDAQGRVRGAITPSGARDEIGDLSRTMAAVLGRLRDYNEYLEAMAGRLSHELRTPVAVVRSSLDNLKAQPLAHEARVYVERADEGVERLARLISRLSEATRLERLLENAERERFDLVRVVVGCVEGYRTAYAGRRFELNVPSNPVTVVGFPDAFAQMMDKLVENAHDFAPAGTPIRVRLAPKGREAVLSVENDGPALSRDTQARLFDSMVSLRGAGERESADGAHLGLGLYMVRLIAQAHGGRVRAENLAADRGVRFEVAVRID